MGQGASKRLNIKPNKFKRKKKHLLNFQQDTHKKFKIDVCRFCKKEGHYQKDCLQHKAWFEKKCTHYKKNRLVCRGLLVGILKNSSLRSFVAFFNPCDIIYFVTI